MSDHLTPIPLPLPLDRMDLNEKARKAMARPFIVGRVTEDWVAHHPEDKDALGSQAMDLSYAHEDADVALRALSGDINRLADADLVIGRRSGPDVWRRRAGGLNEVDMRVMIAPGKNELAQAVVQGREIEG